MSRKTCMFCCGIFSVISSCESVQCFNGGSCVEAGLLSRCQCSAGFTGPECLTGKRSSFSGVIMTGFLFHVNAHSCISWPYLFQTSTSVCQGRVSTVSVRMTWQATYVSVTLAILAAPAKSVS